MHQEGSDTNWATPSCLHRIHVQRRVINIHGKYLSDSENFPKFPSSLQNVLGWEEPAVGKLPVAQLGEFLLFNHSLFSWDRMKTQLGNFDSCWEETEPDIDWKEKLFQTVSFFSRPEPPQEWEDYQLTWDPLQFGGIKSVRMDPRRVWTPDLLLYNRCAKGELRCTLEEIFSV